MKKRHEHISEEDHIHLALLFTEVPGFAGCEAPSLPLSAGGTKAAKTLVIFVSTWLPSCLPWLRRPASLPRRRTATGTNQKDGFEKVKQ